MVEARDPINTKCTTRARPIVLNPTYLAGAVIGGYNVTCTGLPLGLYAIQVHNRTIGAALSIDALSVLLAAVWVARRWRFGMGLLKVPPP